MPKYYISSGTMKQIVVAEDPESAVKEAVLRAYRDRVEKGFSLGRIAVISQRGFERQDGYKDELLKFWKPEFFEELGIPVTFSEEQT